ncbi:MAG: proline racemase family protein [Cyclobacteriaceae bacterium]|nr:proline racemase family protein [Cyclobacteriaceae bacterium]
MSEYPVHDHWHRINTIDMHSEGEPLHVITGGLPEIKGANTLERRRYMRDNLDEYRRSA